MKRFPTAVVVLAAAVFLVLAIPGSAHDLTEVSRPEKTPTIHPQNVPGPRQGGDTILDAVPIDPPVANLTGTTVGFNDDYDEICPYPGSTSPDVVYTFTPAYEMELSIDMFGSAYDTKIFIYDENLELVACNDDYHPDWTSYLESVPVVADVQYFLVIDGYEGDAGDYLLNITEFEHCVVECPAGAEIEGEPEIVDGYVDHFNGGCNSDPQVFGFIDSGLFCGRLGYFISPDGLDSRDLDWLRVFADDFVNPVEITIIAEEATNFYEVEGDCDNVTITNGGVAQPCVEFTLTIDRDGGELPRVLVGPTHFWSGETYEYGYVLEWYFGCIASEHTSWSAVKSLFD